MIPKPETNGDTAMTRTKRAKYSARTIRGYYGGVAHRVVERTGHGFGCSVASPDARAEADTIAVRLNGAGQ